jgi:hypothetical protein
MLPVSDITVTNSFSLPLLLPRSRAGKIYVHVARFPKYQMGLYFRADRLQAISKAVADAIAEQAPFLTDRIVSIGYPVPDAYFFPPGTTEKRKTILFVGRIAREKGVHLLLKAFATANKNAKLPSAWQLRIVGPHEVTQGGDGDDYLQELRRLARPLGSACEFIGPIFEQSALIEKYRSASVFVYPSIAERGEAFGLAALEAMAAGCAVVVSRLGCFAEFIKDGETGLTFDHRASDAAIQLSTQLSRLMSEPRLLDALAQEGHRTAREFRTPAVAARMLDDFASLRGRHQLPSITMGAGTDGKPCYRSGRTLLFAKSVKPHNFGSGLWRGRCVGLFVRCGHRFRVGGLGQHRQRRRRLRFGLRARLLCGPTRAEQGADARLRFLGGLSYLLELEPELHGRIEESLDGCKGYDQTLWNPAE